jgi:hypothetical protein
MFIYNIQSSCRIIGFILLLGFEFSIKKKPTFKLKFLKMYTKFVAFLLFSFFNTIQFVNEKKIKENALALFT